MSCTPQSSLQRAASTRASLWSDVDPATSHDKHCSSTIKTNLSATGIHECLCCNVILPVGTWSSIISHIPTTFSEPSILVGFWMSKMKSGFLRRLTQNLSGSALLFHAMTTCNWVDVICNHGGVKTSPLDHRLNVPWLVRPENQTSARGRATM